MGIEKVGLKLCQRIRTAATGNPTVRKVATNALQMRNHVNGDTFEKITEYTFDEIYNVIKLKNGRIRFVPKVAQVNGKIMTPFDMPEYLYHITSEANFNLMRTTNKIKISANEQLPGVYLLDKENFLTKYPNVGDKKRNLCKSLLEHASNSKSDLIVIRIPAESLARQGRIRIRTQEDFFCYQDKLYELQKGLKQKFTLRSLYDDSNRAKFEKYISENGLMSKYEFEKFMQDMKQRIHYGYSIRDLAQLEGNNAIEYIFNRDIIPDTVKGISVKRFSINECFDTGTKRINIEKLREIFS